MPTRRSPRRILFALLLPLVIAFTLLGASSALAITRAQVLSRAQSWVDHPVPYSQAKYHLGYRTDCSGYVSMCWSTGTSWATSSFYVVTHKVSVGDLKPGDAMLKKGYHIRLFHHWVDASHTSYVAYEAGTKVAVVRVHSLSADLKVGYVPTRYNGILDGPPPTNVIWNSSFDAWLQSWDSGDSPVSWQVSSTPGTSSDSGGSDGYGGYGNYGGYGGSSAAQHDLVAERTDTAHSGSTSLELLNSSDDPTAITEISQTAPVAAGVSYQLSAWARTASDPGALRVGVAYLDASGNTLAETSTAGDAWGLNDVAFRPISVPTTAPAGAVSAIVTVRLEGGTTGGDTGTSATLDDITLTRPQAWVGIKASATKVRAGSLLRLAGTVAPANSAGVTAVVYVQRPGKGWKRLTGATIAAPDGTAAWSAAFAFKRGMRKGVYRFRTTVPSFGTWLGATSATASVRLK